MSFSTLNNSMNLMFIGDPRILFPSSSQTLEFSKISIRVPVLSLSFKNHSNLFMPSSFKLKKRGHCSSLMYFFTSSILPFRVTSTITVTSSLFLFNSFFILLFFSLFSQYLKIYNSICFVHNFKS